jgi:hypothetical protein
VEVELGEDMRHCGKKKKKKKREKEKDFSLSTGFI